MPINSAPTPLFKKLGLKDGFRAGLIGAPAGYLQLLDLPPHWVIHWCSMGAGSNLGAGSDLGAELDMSAGPLDFIHVFTNEVAELESILPAAKSSLKLTGTIWASWFKKSSGLPSELNDNIVRDTALGLGLVDVKVCAIDEQWSGLKLVYRLKDRG